MPEQFPETCTVDGRQIDLGACPRNVIRAHPGSAREALQCRIWLEQIQREFPSAQLAIVKVNRWSVRAMWEGDIESSAMDAAFEASLSRSVDWDQESLRQWAREHSH